MQSRVTPSRSDHNLGDTAAEPSPPEATDKLPEDKVPL